MNKLILTYVLLKLENEELSPKEINILDVYAEQTIRDYLGFPD